MILKRCKKKQKQFIKDYSDMACLNGIIVLLHSMICNHNPRPQNPDLDFIYLTDFCSYSF